MRPPRMPYAQEKAFSITSPDWLTVPAFVSPGVLKALIERGLIEVRRADDGCTVWRRTEGDAT